ncbi:cell division protein FtsL [Lactobacillus sp. PV037]|uniref:cell division protein FtsL n=1 Tax=unclassified Lactobacillus TaxID=2620435 RepID=UPI0022405EEC|nr:MULTISPECIES: cell division protein FtsL [unclassified Lactobacillus]QNQ82464.1 cell division protein FtsL [Lactobacillus sp. PV012]QNQ83422.1 cell division protein FtsL [Lactobacillus sp. PV037]
MADSSARSYTYHHVSVSQDPTPQKRVNLDPNKVPVNKFEKFLIFIGSLAVLVLMILTVSATVSQTQAQQQLSKIENKISAKQSVNTDLKQEIGELTSTKRLNKVAAQNGLHIIESNLRNVR